LFLGNSERLMENPEEEEQALCIKSCTNDGERPSEVGFQEQVSNRLKLLSLTVMVVSIKLFPEY